MYDDTRRDTHPSAVFTPGTGVDPPGHSALVACLPHVSGPSGIDVCAHERGVDAVGAAQCAPATAGVASCARHRTPTVDRGVGDVVRALVSVEDGVHLVFSGRAVDDGGRVALVGGKWGQPVSQGNE